MKQLVLSSTAYLFAAIINRGISFLLLPLYTRVLSPSDYGSLDLLLMFGVFVNLVVALEISQGLARHWQDAKDRKKRQDLISTAFWFSLMAYLIFGLLVVGNSHLVAPIVMANKGVEAEFTIGILYICVNGMYLLMHNLLRWRLETQLFTAISVLTASLTAITSVVLTQIFGLKLMGIICGLLVGVALPLPVLLWTARNELRFSFDLDVLRNMLSFSWPLVFSSLSVWLATYIDRLMINSMLSLDAVGTYGVAVRISSISLIVIAGFQGALTPYVYANKDEVSTPKEVADIFIVFSAAALAVSLFVIVFGVEIFSLLATPAFYSGEVLLALLIPAMFLSKMYIFAPGLAIAKRTGLILAINIAVAVINLGMNAVLIPLSGVWGAAVATFSSQLLGFVLYVRLGAIFYPIPFGWKSVLSGVSVIFVAVVGAKLTQGSTWSTEAQIGTKTVLFFTGLILILFLFRKPLISTLNPIFIKYSWKRI